MDTKPFSEEVTAVRTALHLSQEDLAHALDGSFATVNRWENKKTKPSRLAQRCLTNSVMQRENRESWAMNKKELFERSCRSADHLQYGPKEAKRED